MREKTIIAGSVCYSNTKIILVNYGNGYRNLFNIKFFDLTSRLSLHYNRGAGNTVIFALVEFALALCGLTHEIIYLTSWLSLHYNVGASDLVKFALDSALWRGQPD